MSSSDPSNRDTAELAVELSSRLADAVDRAALDILPDDVLGQLYGTLTRFYAARALSGPAPRPFARNSGITATDVMINCTAQLDSVGLNVFELGQWQAWTRIGDLRADYAARMPKGDAR